MLVFPAPYREFQGALQGSVPSQSLCPTRQRTAAPIGDAFPAERAAAEAERGEGGAGPSLKPDPRSGIRIPQVFTAEERCKMLIFPAPYREFQGALQASDPTQSFCPPRQRTAAPKGVAFPDERAAAEAERGDGGAGPSLKPDS